MGKKETTYILIFLLFAILIVSSILYFNKEGREQIIPNNQINNQLTLEGREWTWVETLYNNDIKLRPNKAEAFKLEFNDGRVGITTDCNSGSGAYVIDDNKIEIKNIASTKMACSDTQEEEFFKMLEEVNSYFFAETGRLVFDLKFDVGSSIFK